MDENEKNNQETISLIKYLIYIIQTPKPNSVDIPQKDLYSIECFMVQTALSNVIDALYILNKGFTVSNSEKYKPIPICNLIDHGKDKIKLFDKSTLEPVYRTLSRISAVKFESDVEDIRHILADCLIELNIKKSFSCLTRYIDDRQQAAHREFELISKFTEQKEELERLQINLKRLQCEAVETKKSYHERIGDLMNLKLDTELECELKENLITKWEEQRVEQVQTITEGEEYRLSESKKHYLMKQDNEHLAINEIENFVNFKITSFKQQIETWIVRHREDTIKLREMINVLKKEHEDFIQKNVEIKQMIEERQCLIVAYREKQHQEMERKALELLKHRAAKKIQMWWRELMIRLQLGPYVPKKGKGKKFGNVDKKKK